MNVSDLDAPVLIAGGGLVGLSTAMFLAQHGTRSLVVERLKEISPLPRAAFFHMRTLEMFRSAGIEEQVREGSRNDFVPEGALIVAESIATGKRADIIGNLNEGVDAVSPCRRLFLNQPSLEPILRDKARECGAQVLAGHEVIGLTQDSEGVTLRVCNVETGEERALTGRYLVAADGARSKVRDVLGIAYEGHGVFSNSVTIYFTADLSPWIGDNAWSIIYINNKVCSGFFRMNRASTAGFFAINTVGDPTLDPVAASNVGMDLSEARLIELVRAGVGVADLDIRIDGISRWRATADVARKFRDGRVFVAGDAAHLMPPTGGFGGNTGIHDAHNLAWKLAYVLRGSAGEKLLDTYEPERKPVAKFTVEQAFARFVTRTAPWLRASQKTDPIADDFEIEIGYLYESPAVIAEPGARKGHADPRETGGMPGSRLPHLWIHKSGKKISTLDLVNGFALIAGADGEGWAKAARQVEGPHDFAFDTYLVGRDISDPDDAFCQACGIEKAGAILVRPDGVVAWRASGIGPRSAEVLERALRRVLCFDR